MSGPTMELRATGALVFLTISDHGAALVELAFDLRRGTQFINDFCDMLATLDEFKPTRQMLDEIEAELEAIKGRRVLQ